jgi:phosphoglycerate mutase, BPG-dependent, family 1
MDRILILVRHGESQWNKWNLFTGWSDVDLSEKGIREAKEAADYLLEKGYEPEICFTSYLKRAIRTLNFILDEMDMSYLPVEKSWRLNEKHYGALQGLNKKKIMDMYGYEKVHLWRRSYDIQAPALKEDDTRSPRMDDKYKNVPQTDLPLTESLKDCINRCMPFFQDHILKAFETHRQVLVVAHGNSLRGIVKKLKHISDEDITDFNIPTGIPYVFRLNENNEYISDEFVADPIVVQKLMAKVANQTQRAR